MRGKQMNAHLWITHKYEHVIVFYLRTVYIHLIHKLFFLQVCTILHEMFVLWIQHALLCSDAGEDEGSLDFSALLKAAKK